MPSFRDAYEIAQEMRRQYGDAARGVCVQRVAAHRAAGDEEGARLWEKVEAALKHLG